MMGDEREGKISRDNTEQYNTNIHDCFKNSITE